MLIAYDFIAGEAARIMKAHDESDPRRLAQSMGFLLLYQPMGNYDGACKGFFLLESRIKSITINNDLPEHMQRVILSHEIGHGVLHAKEAGGKAFQEFSLFNNKSRYEYEANVFAAEVAMKDKEVIRLLRDTNNFFDVASELSVPPELLDFKFRTMKAKGIKLPQAPILSNGDFLKDI